MEAAAGVPVNEPPLVARRLPTELQLQYRMSRIAATLPQADPEKAARASAHRQPAAAIDTPAAAALKARPLKQALTACVS